MANLDKNSLFEEKHEATTQKKMSDALWGNLQCSSLILRFVSSQFFSFADVLHVLYFYLNTTIVSLKADYLSPIKYKSVKSITVLITWG